MKTTASLVVLASAYIAAIRAAAPNAGSSSDTYLSLPTQSCTSSGCTTNNDKLVFDANWRWYHDGVVESVNYAEFGLSTSSNLAKLKFLTNGNVGSRSYLLESSMNYRSFSLVNKEISFDVDMSSMECGMNAALYFVEMPLDGGSNAGAAYGTGYCDAQCPSDKFQGVNKCCPEIDVWEANKRAEQIAVHGCNAPGVSTSGCDSGGCYYNPYKAGNHSYYGYGSSFTIDTTRPFTVITQFVTNDGTDSGSLTGIKRYYKQDGVLIPNNQDAVMDDTMCGSISSTRMAQIEASFRSGVVLAFSLWTGGMTWLDAGDNGPCTSATDGTNTVMQYTNSVLTIGNIKYGAIGSTSGSTPSTTAAPTPTSPPTTATPTTATPTTATPTSTPSATTSSGYQYCTTTHDDSDGDGYAWEVDQLCVIPGSVADPPETFEYSPSGRPYCVQVDYADPDGDGWGYEYSHVCVVKGSDAANY